MPISHAEPITLTCPACGTSHTANIWLIVAPDERPDLLEQIRNGSLHTVTCPQCGQTHTLDAPLLIFRPTAEPPILFAPAQQTSAEQDQEHANALISILRQRLGAAWNDAWLGQGPAVVPRQLLPLALTDDPEAALQELAAQMQQALAELRRRDPEAFARLEAAAQQAMEALPEADRSPDEAPESAATTDAPAPVQALDAFLNARTWLDSYREVQAHPELLSDEALALLEQRIAAARAVGNSRAVAFFEEHLALLRRCREVGIPRAFAAKMLPPETLAQAIEAAVQAMDIGSGVDVPSRFRNVLQQAKEAEQRYRRTGDRAALDAAAAAWQRVLDDPAFARSQERFQLAAMNDAGGIFLQRYRSAGHIADLNRAIELLQRAVDLTPPDSPDRPARLTNLGLGLSVRYARSGRLAELDAAIAAFEQALAATPPDSPDRPARLTNLGLGLSVRYARSGRLAELDAAIAAFEQALAATPPDSPDRPARLTNLGLGLSDRYARSGRLEDLDAAIAAFEQALAATPPDSPARPGYLNNLGNGLSDRYARSGRLEDLDAAIAAYEQALDATPPDSPARPAILTNLGIGLRDRYARSGRLEDLDAAIAAYEQALDATPPDSPARPAILTNLGSGLSDRYARSGRLEDLDAAIAAWQQALDATPPDSPARPAILTNLGSGLRDRYARSGRLEELDAAIAAWQQALDATPPDSPDRPARLTNLGLGLSVRYARSGRLAELDAAIAAFEQALAATPPDSPDRPARLTNLGNGLRARYARSGRLEDLDAAIAAWQQALDATPPDSPDRPGYLNNLGIGLRDRYARSGRLEDLDAAIAAYEQALDATPPDSPDRPARLTNLGSGLSDRYARSGRLEELDAAIAAWQQALDATPPDSPARPAILTNLGSGLSDRYARSGRLEELDAAIAAWQQALDATPPDSPARPGYLNNLGSGLRARYARSGRLEELKQARRSYALACKQGQLLAPEIALAASQSWGRWAGERHHWKETAYAFGFGLETIEQLHRAQLRRSEQELWLSDARGLHTSAAYALVRAARPSVLRRAVEVAELGRARGLGETLARDRSDLSIIERQYPDIYERYRAAAEVVRSLERTDRATTDRQDEAQPSFTELANRIRAARADLDAAIEAIRAIPGYETFLRPPAYAEIAAAAQPDVPLVYLITTSHGSLALIVPHGNVELEALLLDEFTENDLNNILLMHTGDKVTGGYLPGQLLGGKMLETALAMALPILGERLIAPLAQRLRALNATGVTLIPTGLLSLLPLHAATYMVDGASRCLLDEFDVAYAPSARVLAIAQREQQRRAAKGVRLAGVGNPTGDLRYAGAELHSICDLLPPAATTTFYEQAATRNAIWSALGESTIGHFSCHGSFADDPLDSALHLAAGDRITLRDLVAGDTTALSNLRLVALSACQTAITDFRRLPDESIGLPGGFLQAGVPAVVGTLWSVNDLSTALLMHRFYELHLHGDDAAGLAPQPPVRALRLAQQWLRDLTYKEMFDYFQRHRQLKAVRQHNSASAQVSGVRMPSALIEVGRALAEEYMLDHPNKRPYTNPIFWAAFTFNGAMGGAA
ncbi:CHAT domain-containing protein [Chloroflexus sp. Y-396-1]|uniref:CHAT domain-containing protein n=1 Tax=Chloroflexus sp. Y-396-1 TaxID=867845 RepID=UPI0004BBFF2B|nr:CHAT domain-containing protein [Chloroflexus sp. Y-396-1]